MNQDDVPVGLKRMGDYEFTGTWEPWGAGAERLWHVAQSQPRHVVLRNSIRLFGVDWWSVSTEFDAHEVFSSETRDDGMTFINAEMKVAGDMVVTRSEWWRRLGYYTLAKPVDRMRWHLWYRWRQPRETLEEPR